MNLNSRGWAALTLITLFVAGCSRNDGSGTINSEATQTTVKANGEFAKNLGLNLQDGQDFEDAKRGFIAKPTGKITKSDGTVLKNFADYEFEQGDAPATVNPSLWRHALLNANYGLFKVTDGVYQLRGFDIANMTLIEGKTGWIVVDTLTAKETAAAAIAFAREHLGNKPITGVVFTHSHVDHFGGVLGLVTPEEVEKRKLPIVAPAGFMEEATSENVLVGTGMARRSIYQFGRDLPRSAKGNVDTGLGKEVAYGSVGILPPQLADIQPDSAHAH